MSAKYVRLMAFLLVIVFSASFAFAPGTSTPLSPSGSPSPSPSPGPDCGDTISENTVLTDDVTGCDDVGLEIDTDNVILDCDGYKISGTDTEPPAVYITADNVTVKNCDITGGFAYGVYFSETDNATIYNNIINDTEYGIYGTSSSYWAHVTRNTITNGAYGIYGESVYQDDIFEYNEIYNMTDYGIYLTYLENASISHNIIDNVTGGDEIGIYLSSVDVGFVNNNTITNATQYGIFFEGSENLTIEDNEIDHSEAGIYGYVSNYWMHVNNNIVKNGDVGIYSDNVYQDDIFNYNEIYNMSAYGIYLIYMENLTVNHNIIDNVTGGKDGTCMYLSNIDVGTANNNTITNCDDHGIYVWDSDNMTIEANEVTNASYGLYAYISNYWMHVNRNVFTNTSTGIYGFVTYEDDVIEYNEIYNATDYGIRFESIWKANVNHNTISNVSNGHGIYLSGVDYSNFTNNTISDAYDTGFYLTNSENNIISDGHIYDNNLGSSSSYGGIILTGNSKYNTIKDIYMHDNAWGAVQVLSGSDHNTIDANNIDNNCGNEWQIRCHESSYLTIKNNNITDGSGDGVRAESGEGYCEYMTVTNNNISGNQDYGVYGNRIDHSRFSENEMNSNGNYGLYLISVDNFTSTNDEFKYNNNEGVYLSNSGSSDTVEFKNAAIENNTNGIYLTSSELTVRNSNFRNNAQEEAVPFGSAVPARRIAYAGIYMSNSDLNLFNTNFINNGDYGVYEESSGDDSGYWTITEDVTCTDNDIWFEGGWVSVEGGSMTATNCEVTVGGTVIDFSNEQTGYKNESLEIPSGGNKTVNASEYTVEIHSDNGFNATVVMETFDDVPTGVTGFALEKLGKWIEFDTSSTEGNMSWAIIKIPYTTAELTAAGLNESSLVIEYYNETSDTWTRYGAVCGLAPCGGVNKTGNYVWANTTHFSGYGVFGTAPVTPSSPAPTTTTPSSRHYSDAPPGPVPTYAGHETSFVASRTQEQIRLEVETHENTRNGLQDAGVDVSNPSELNNVIALSARISQHLSLESSVEHVSNTESELVLTLTYNGEENLEGQVIVVDVPKSFAADASLINVEANGATIIITNSDPVFTIVFDSLDADSVKTIRFTTDSYVNRETVNNEFNLPNLFTLGVEEDAPVVTPVPTVAPTPVATPVPTPKPEVADIIPPTDTPMDFSFAIVVLVIGALAVVLMVKQGVIKL